MNLAIHLPVRGCVAALTLTWPSMAITNPPVTEETGVLSTSTSRLRYHTIDETGNDGDEQDLESTWENACCLSSGLP